MSKKEYEQPLVGVLRIRMMNLLQASSAEQLDLYGDTVEFEE